MLMLQAGEQATQIILWDVDDPAKQGDPRFWWTPEQRFKLPDGRPLHGPKGTSLAKLRERCGGEEIELDLPPAARPAQAAADVGRITVSTEGWGVSDPERIYVIVSHHYRPTVEEAAEEKSRRGDASPFPADAEAVRQKWLAALQAGDHDTAADLKEQFDERLRKQGWLKPHAQPGEGIELQPGVYLLDTRPQPLA